MLKTKRKRAVVLALIAFFCTATTYVAVDWKRLGGGFLALLKGRNDTSVASTGGGQASGAGGHAADSGDPLPAAPTHPSLIALANARRHASGTGGGSGGHKSDEDDLFKYGNPAAGGIPPGSFVVARNDAPAGASNGAGAPPAPGPGAPQADSPAPAGTGPGVSSPAPAPTSTGGISDIGLPITKPPASPSPPATSPPPAVSPPPPTTPVAPPVTTQPLAPSPPPPADAPAPPPSQAGSTDSNPTGDDPAGGDGSTGSGGSTTAPQGPGSVSAVPEASSLSMMGLGALFLAAAVRRKDRKNG